MLDVYEKMIGRFRLDKCRKSVMNREKRMRNGTDDIEVDDEDAVVEDFDKEVSYTSQNGDESLIIDFDVNGPCVSHKNGIVLLLERQFPTIYVDTEALCDEIIRQHPVGCVLVEADDCPDSDCASLDDENEDEIDVFALVTAVPLKSFTMEKVRERAFKDVNEKFINTTCLLINLRIPGFPSNYISMALTALKRDLRNCDIRYENWAIIYDEALNELYPENEIFAKYADNKIKVDSFMVYVLSEKNIEKSFSDISAIPALMNV